MSLREIVEARNRELAEKYHAHFQQGPSIILSGVDGNYYTEYYLSKDQKHVFVSIEGKYSGGYGDDTVNLTPEEALDLLKWLKDEEATLLKIQGKDEIA